MSNGFTDKVKGSGNKLKGEVKESIGRNTNDPSLQAEGKKDQVKGETQEKVGDVKKKITNIMDHRK